MELNREINKVKNSLVVEGILAEKNLEYSSYKKDGKDVECIRGDVKIKVSSTNTITVKVFSNKLKADGTVGNAYKGMETIMKEHKAISEVGESEADKVVALGKLNPRRPYKTQDGNVVSGNEYSANFISRIKDEAKYNPRAELIAEVFIRDKKMEMKPIDGVPTETGRLIVKCALPIYGGNVAVFDAFAVEEGKDYFEDDVEKGRTIPVTFRLDTRVEQGEKKATTGGFGKKPSDNTFDKVYSEIIIDGADEQYEEFDSEETKEQKAFDPKAIAELLTEYANKIKQVEESEAPAPKTPTANKGFGNKPKASVPTTTVEDMEDDLPF